MKNKLLKKGILILLVLLAFIDLKAQNINAKKNTLTKVFNNLVNAYGNAKGKPALILIPKSHKQNYIAAYFSDTPNIKVDEKLFDICAQMGPDSLNALSIILSHELAHYYNDHNWCSDYAFAIRNTAIGKKIKEESKETKINHEREADNFGIYHCCLAGYHPFGIYKKLLDNIYSAYNLPERMDGYPAKKERDTICEQAQRRIATLYSEFLVGNKAIKIEDFELAINCFDDLTKYFPSRENYNNLGTAKTLWAIKLRPLEKMQAEDPNFFYPIMTDSNSRLKIVIERNLDEGAAQKMNELLNSARSDFEKAISLDHEYDVAYINLACVFDLMDNPEAAIGEIKKMPINKQNQEKAYRILGIAYYHTDNEKKSKEMFKKVSDVNNHN